MRLAVIIVLAVVLALVAAHRRTAVTAKEAPNPAPVWDRASMKPVMAPRPRPVVVQQKGLSTADARYNPVAYLDQEGGALDAKDIYLNEPRDPKYAPIFEKRLNTTLGSIIDELKLTKDVKAVHVDCRTLSCSTTIEAAPNADVRELYNELNGIILGDVQEPGMDQSDPDHPQVTIYNVYRPESRDDDSFQQILDKGTRPALDFTKKRLGKDKPDEAVP